MDYFNSDIIFDKEYLGNYRRIFKAPLIDRSGVKNRQIKPLTLIPKVLDCSDTDFAAITDARSIEILERAERENKNIRVSYSGGIDSVTALVGLLKHKDAYPSVEIQVVLSQLSIEEYPKFYTEFIEGKLKVIRADGKLLYKKLLAKDDKPFLIVTGELGDQLFGSAIMFRETRSWRYRLAEPWDEVFSEKFVTYWKPLVDRMPHRDVITVAEVYWWFNFVLKYQWVQLRMYAMVKGEMNPDDLVHFFSGNRYQNWAMITPMSGKFPDLNDPKTYKYPAKKYIFDYTGDDIYFKHKLKVGSLKENTEVPIRQEVHRITEQLEFIGTDETNQTQ